MNFSFYIAKRYLFTKSKNNAINIITFIAGLGAFAGAMALFIVLSGFAGLKDFSIQFTNEIDPDLKVEPLQGKTITLNAEKTAELKKLEGIADFSRVIEEHVLLTYENRSTPAYIKGVDQHYNEITSTNNAIIIGRWFDQDEKRVVIGGEISRKLSLGVSGRNDVLQLLVPKPGKGIITDPTKAFKQYNTLVSGVYDINEDLNDQYVFAPINIAQTLLGLDENQVSGIEIKLRSLKDEKAVTAALISLFDQEVSVRNRIQQNDELYKMLNTENLVVYLIFTLVLIIALFNVGGAIVMAILDKQYNIHTLFNLGASARSLRRIFFLQGSLLTFVSGIIGLFIGVVLVLLQEQVGFVMITRDLPYPVGLKLDNILIVFGTIMLLGVTASYIGSTRVSKVLKLKPV